MAKNKKQSKKPSKDSTLQFETEEGTFVFQCPSFTHKGRVYKSEDVLAAAEKEGDKGGPNQELLATLVKISSGVIKKGG